MSRILVTAPYVGEIGWELLSWQGRVRRVFTDGDYDRVIVLGSAGKAAFYDGMPLEYRNVDLGYLPGTAFEDRRVITTTNECVSTERLRQCVGDVVQSTVLELTEQGDTAEVLWPEYNGTLWSCNEPHQTFIQYQRPVVNQPAAPWVVLVQRTRSFGDENWSASDWAELQQRLEAQGVHTSVYPCDSEAAITMLSGCDLAVGQTTGGMHLAMLCGCPILTWSFYDFLLWLWEITNRQRFETWWNPFGSPVILRDVRQLPTPQSAADQVMRALGSIGRRTGSRLHRAAFNCKYAIRTALKRTIIEPQRYSRWPWLLQKLVRYQLA
jgi:hypothetical protein